MTWSPHIPQGFESRKIWPFVIPYARGRGLDIGCGVEPCLPHMIGVDSGKAFGHGAATIKAEADELGIFANESLDFIFSSHLLEHIEPEKVGAVLEHWASKLKFGGNLILYVPSANHYPKVGEPGANPDHKWNVYPGMIEQALKAIDGGCRWVQVECEERSDYDEYSLFEVYRKLPLSETEPNFVKVPWRRGVQKRCLIFRLGAIGDCLVAASPCKALHDDGFHVTMMTSAAGGELFQNNPWIDELIVLDREMFPAVHAAGFTERLKERYDRVVYLDRSLEGLLLAREENHSFEYPVEARRYLFGDKNYYETALHIAGVPRVMPAPGVHLADEEIAWANHVRTHIEPGPVVVWALSGSSFFKLYPALNVVAGMLTADGINVVLVGEGETSKLLEMAIVQTMVEDGANTKRIYPQVGKWTLRKSIAVATKADCVVGPETGLMHAVAFADVPKVIYLSHSAPENLLYYWKNTTYLAPAADLCPCYPCHQVHIVKETCHYDEKNGGALCTTTIAPQWVYGNIKHALGLKGGG